MANLFQDSAILFAASDLGIFEALSRLGTASAASVASELSLNARAAGLMLDACVAVDLLEKHGDCYRNTPESAALLVPGTPGDLSKALLYMRDVYPAWSRLGTFVKSGEPAESPQLHLGDDASRTRNFVLSMHGKALATAQVVVCQACARRTQAASGCRRRTGYIFRRNHARVSGDPRHSPGSPSRSRHRERADRAAGCRRPRDDPRRRLSHHPLRGRQ